MDHPAILVARKTRPFGELTSRADSRLPNAVAGRAVLPDALFNDPGERLSASLSADCSQAGGGKAAERASPLPDDLAYDGS
jgi:hypothetical protein